MDESSREPDPDGTKSALRVVIAYGDLPAGKRTMRLLGTLSQGMAGDLEFQPLPWSFEMLAESEWRDLATRDVVNADMLILATSDTRPIPSSVVHWVDTVIRRKQGSSAAVVALLGQEEDSDAATSTQLEAIQAAARQAGLAFFAPTPRRELNETIARIHQRAKTVTPLLADMFHRPADPRRKHHP